MATITLTDAQVTMLRGILGVVDGDAPALTEAVPTTVPDRARDPKTGRYVKAGSKAAVKATKKAGKKARAAKKAKQDDFVAWLQETAEQRHARQSSNREMAAWMRSKGLVPNGQAWAAAKHGERSVAKLRKLNDADGLLKK